uniref:Uncharacterized protein n=1 Tax=Arundo donax TaxID=35708 RepID=A0A0A9APY5_ARUDO
MCPENRITTKATQSQISWGSLKVFQCN